MYLAALYNDDLCKNYDRVCLGTISTAAHFAQHVPIDHDQTVVSILNLECETLHTLLEVLKRRPTDAQIQHVARVNAVKTMIRLAKANYRVAAQAHLIPDLAKIIQRLYVKAEMQDVVDIREYFISRERSLPDRLTSQRLFVIVRPKNRDYSTLPETIAVVRNARLTASRGKHLVLILRLISLQNHPKTDISQLDHCYLLA